MNRITNRFNAIKSGASKPLICFLTAGDPDLATTARIVPAIHKAGADIVELGIPFSDPMADGPVIQAAGFRALQNGATVDGVFECVRDIRKTCEIPLVLMTYFNPVQHYGLERFAKTAVEVGADGAILTDLPADEATEWIQICEKHNLATVFLVAPTSTDDRVRLTADCTTGFVYCVSRLGVTGTQSSLASGLPELVTKIKSLTNKPVAVGFGISTAEQVNEVTKAADGVVVGSALVKVIASSETPDEAVENAVEFVSGLR